MPTRLHDALTPMLKEVRLLSDRATIAQVAETLTPLREALNITDDARTSITSKQWAPPRYEAVTSAQAVVMATERRRLFRAPAVTTDEATALLESALVVHHQWVTKSVRDVAALREGADTMERVRNVLEDFADRTNAQGAMDRYIRQDVSTRIARAVTAARTTADTASATIGAERTKVIPLLESLFGAIYQVGQYPRDRGLRNETHAAAMDAVDTLMGMIAREEREAQESQGAQEGGAAVDSLAAV